MKASHNIFYCVHVQSSLSYPEGKPSMLHHVISHGLVEQVGKSFNIADEFMIHVFKAHVIAVLPLTKYPIHAPTSG